MPFRLPAPEQPPDPPTEKQAVAVLAELRAHCAPSTWARLAASARHRHYPHPLPD